MQYALPKIDSRVKNQIAIIGVGNPLRGDDGVGWAVIEALQGNVPHTVDLHRVRGTLTELFDLLQRYSTVYLIDACVGVGGAGTWKRIDSLEECLRVQQNEASTHGLGIAQAIRLAKELRQLPKQLIVYAIQGEQYEHGALFSRSVQEAIAPVVERILRELTCGEGTLSRGDS